jgi:prolipoprotein diacylglyceryltransferase
MGCALGIGLSMSRGLALWVMFAIVPLAILIFLMLAMATKMVVGDETLVYYHQEIAVISGIGLFLRALHQPVLPYVDIAILGIGVTLAFGRIGCVLAGCCYGRPFKWGVRYTDESRF